MGTRDMKWKPAIPFGKSPLSNNLQQPPISIDFSFQRLHGKRTVPYTVLSSTNFWFPHNSLQLGSDTKIKKPKRKLAKYKGSLKHTGGETLNSLN